VKNNKTSEPILLVDSHYGIYQPQILAEYIKSQQDDISKQLFNSIASDDLETCLAGPDDEFYWDAYCDIENSARCIINKVEYFICQNEDTWLIPAGYDFDNN
jgi:hypothetical protein